MRGAGYRIFKNRSLRGKEPGDKIAGTPLGRDNDTAGIQVDLIEELPVDLYIPDILFAFIDQHIIPGLQHEKKMPVERLADDIGQWGRGELQGRESQRV